MKIVRCSEYEYFSINSSNIFSFYESKSNAFVAEFYGFDRVKLY